MYYEYYANYKTGELKLVGTPREAMKLYNRDGWRRIEQSEWELLHLVAKYAKEHRRGERKS